MFKINLVLVASVLVASLMRQSVRGATHVEIDKSVKVVVISVVKLVVVRSKVEVGARALLCRHGLVEELAYAPLIQVQPVDKSWAYWPVEAANFKAHDGFCFNSRLSDGHGRSDTSAECGMSDKVGSESVVGFIADDIDGELCCETCGERRAGLIVFG